MAKKRNKTHKRYADNKLKQISKWSINKKDKKELRQFLEDYKNGDVTGHIASNPEALIERKIQHLQPAFIFLSKKKGKAISEYEAKHKDRVKKLKNVLLKDKIGRYDRKEGKYNGKPYSIRGKKDIMSSLKQFLEWKHDSETATILSKPLNVKFKKKDKDRDYLTLNEIEKLYKACETAEERYFIAVLFSSGARANEFHNIRYSDITMPEGDESFVKVRIRSENSKTKGRSISLYWGKALEAVREYLKERKEEGIEPEDYIYEKSYEGARSWLYRFSKKVLGKRIHHHMFRHSCATWLSSRMNRQQMCYYFGWRFSSNMADKYIRRSGVNMKSVDDRETNTKLEELKNKLEKETQEKDMKIEKLKENQQELKEVLFGGKEQEDLLGKYNPKEMSFEELLQRKRKNMEKVKKSME